jgi:hypothetical protein
MSAMYSQPRTVVSNPNFQLHCIECHRPVERWKKMMKWHSLRSSPALVLGSLHVLKTTLALMVPKSEAAVSGILGPIWGACSAGGATNLDSGGVTAGDGLCNGMLDRWWTSCGTGLGGSGRGPRVLCETTLVRGTNGVPNSWLGSLEVSPGVRRSDGNISKPALKRGAACPNDGGEA